MNAAFETHGPCVILGSDTPTLPSTLVSAAVASVQTSTTSHIAFGPASDGGYWTLGAHQPLSFENVRFGTSHALTDTVRANPNQSRTMLAPWYDVDIVDDLRLLRLHVMLDPGVAPHTARLLHGLKNRGRFLLEENAPGHSRRKQ